MNIIANNKFNEYDFDFKKYESLKDKVCIHCESLLEATKLSRLLDFNGYVWSSGTRYLDLCLFWMFGKNSCYFFNVGRIGSLKEANNRKVKIIEFKEIEKGEM